MSQPMSGYLRRLLMDAREALDDELRASGEEALTHPTLKAHAAVAHRIHRCLIADARRRAKGRP